MKQSEQERGENNKKVMKGGNKCNKMGKRKRQMFVTRRLAEKTQN